MESIVMLMDKKSFMVCSHASISDFMDYLNAMYSLVSRFIMVNEYANSLFLCSVALFVPPVSSLFLGLSFVIASLKLTAFMHSFHCFFTPSLLSVKKFFSRLSNGKIASFVNHSTNVMKKVILATLS